jgi:hypothetical protein
MKIEHSLPANPSKLYLVVALMLVAPAALAQEAKAAAPDAVHAPAATILRSEATVDARTPTTMPRQDGEQAVAEDENPIYEPLQVGDATQALLAWQSGGEISSATPRPIAGAVANRSYERYLKSFEFPIPERMTSSVKSNGGNGSAGK